MLASCSEYLSCSLVIDWLSDGRDSGLAGYFEAVCQTLLGARARVEGS